MPCVPLVAGNWKMNKTVAEAEQLIQALLPRVASLDGVEIAICPPFTALRAMIDSAFGSRVAVFAQNMHEADHGAFTGEISVPMLRDVGVSGVIIGHSERRAYFGETDERLASKLPVALDAGLQPILCVGESESQRLAGETESLLRRQLEAAFANVEPERYADVAIAYEPIWAIGTGRSDKPEDAREMAVFIKKLLKKTKRVSPKFLYGGSVNGANAADFVQLKEIDGALVGGASLKAEEFKKIINI